MAKLTDSLNTFKTGDLVFTRYPVKIGGQPIHLTIFLDGTAQGGPGFVHAGGTRLEISGTAGYAVDKDSGGYLRVFSANDALRRNIADVASIFARDSPKTAYGDFPKNTAWSQTTGGEKINASRFTGMIRTTTVAQIPFEFASLRRLLKWTHRAVTQAPFSENRGITCAAFGSACVQVAGMRAFLAEFGMTKDVGALEKTLKILAGLSVTKESLREGRLAKFEQEADGKTTTYYQNQAWRENSNRALSDKGKLEMQDLLTYEKDGRRFAHAWLRDALKSLGVPDLNGFSQVEKVWLAVQCQMLGIDPYLVRRLSDIIDPTFFFDAKYVSSMALSAIFPTGNWNSTPFTEY